MAGQENSLPVGGEPTEPTQQQLLIMALGDLYTDVKAARKKNPGIGRQRFLEGMQAFAGQIQLPKIAEIVFLFSANYGYIAPLNQINPHEKATESLAVLDALIHEIPRIARGAYNQYYREKGLKDSEFPSFPSDLTDTAITVGKALGNVFSVDQENLDLTGVTDNISTLYDLSTLFSDEERQKLAEALPELDKRLDQLRISTLKTLLDGIDTDPDAPAEETPEE